MLDNVATGNVTSSAGVAPPIKLPAIVIISPTSNKVPPVLIPTDAVSYTHLRAHET